MFQSVLKAIKNARRRKAPAGPVPNAPQAQDEDAAQTRDGPPVPADKPPGE